MARSKRLRTVEIAVGNMDHTWYVIQVKIPESSHRIMFMKAASIVLQRLEREKREVAFVANYAVLPVNEEET